MPPSGKVIGAKELQLMVEASLDGWLTTGRFNDAFEKKLGEFIGVPHVLTTTSGSSANLLALTALTSPKLGERALKLVMRLLLSLLASRLQLTRRSRMV